MFCNGGQIVANAKAFMKLWQLKTSVSINQKSKILIYS